MTTKEFVQWALETKGLTKYRLAMTLKLAPTSINQYLRGTRMSTVTADVVKSVYGVTIVDSYNRGQ